MDLLKQYISKRYFLYWIIFFCVWYPISFLFSVTYTVTQNNFLSVAMNTYFPILLFLFSFHYFKKSKNDWNDRFILGFGWIFLSIFLSAILVQPMYGYSWTTVFNMQQFIGNWISLFVVLLAGIVAEGHKKK